ncbi:MAG: ATP-binding protein [Candidatus Omnitrophota bacterium]
MSIYVFSAALTFLTSLLLGFFVFIKNPKSLINRTWFLLSGSIAFWSFFLAFMFASKNAESGLFYSKMLQIGAIIIPASCLHFIVSLLHVNRQERFAVVASYLFCLLLLVMNVTPYFIKEALYTDMVDCFYPRASYLYIFFILFFFLAPGYGTYLLIKEYKSESNFRKNQLGYCIGASFIGFLGGSTTFPLWYDIHFSPIGVNLVWLYVVIITIAIVRYQLLDIEVIVKKTLVFAGLFGFVFGVIVFVAILTQEFIAMFLPHSKFLSLAISAVIIVLLHQPIYNLLINLTNKHLFQKKYDARKVFHDFSNEALTILNLDRLCRITIETLVKNLYLKNCVIFLLSRDETFYEVYDSFGVNKQEVVLKRDSRLISYFKLAQAPVLYNSYTRDLQACDEIKKEMQAMQSQLCVPLTIHNDIVGVLSLGPKKSDQPYMFDDIDILSTLAKALSIAISNARLFAQAAQYEKLATIGTLASGINHEVCNPLNNMSMRMQIFMANLERGAYKDKTQDEILAEVKDVLSSSITQIHKVAGITGKLSSFAKPTKTVLSKKVNVSQSVDAALDVLGHKLMIDRIKAVKNIPSGLVDILADEDQMHQIFFNLIRNAAQAIKEEGEITISAREDSGKVKIEVADTGCGIPEDKIEKIFEPFYTTKADGSGYGLSIVREVVWRNKGEIKVESKIGKGSTFYLEFPKA